MATKAQFQAVLKNIGDVGFDPPVFDSLDELKAWAAKNPAACSAFSIALVQQDLMAITRDVARCPT